MVLEFETLERVCVNCGKTFSFENRGHSKRRKFCTRKCKVSYHLRKNKKKYNNAKCLKDKARRRGVLSKEVEHQCVQCSERFIARSTLRKKYCTKRCQDMAAAKRQKERIGSYSKHRISRLLTANRCTACSRPLEETMKTIFSKYRLCPKCLDEKAKNGDKGAWVKKRREERKRNNLCVHCGEVPPREGRTDCQKCFEKQREYRQKRVSFGACIGCGDKVDTHAKLCAKCRPKSLARGKEYAEKLRQEVINHYGGKCECCDESHIGFLSIDHIAQDGARHRRENKASFYHWLRRENYPGGFRVLCRKCNRAVFWHAQCPHKLTPEQLEAQRQSEWTPHKRSEWKARDKVFALLGDKCAKCKETIKEFLQIDHVHNDGHEHRKETGIKGGADMYRWLLKNPSYLPRVQLLCENCNFDKSIGLPRPKSRKKPICPSAD